MSQPDLPWAHFRVALSFPYERLDFVAQVDARLTAALGPQAVFFFPRFLAARGAADLGPVLRAIYQERSSLVAVFLDQHYGTRHWCGVEWRTLWELGEQGKWDRVLPIALDDDFGELGIRLADGCFDSRELGAEAIAGEILARLARLEGRSGPPAVSTVVPRRQLAPVRTPRRWLDATAPAVHRALTDLFHLLPQPEERKAVEGWLIKLDEEIRHRLKEKEYLPLHAQSVDREEAEGELVDPFAQLVHQNIREVLGLDLGGDSASAEVAAVNRRSRLVRKLEETLLASREPLVLLGAPGSGKTMTLQKTAVDLAAAERRRVFPRAVLSVRLGEFHVDERPPEVADLRRLVRGVCPRDLLPWLDALEKAGRLVVLFDGMDEMSREGYGDHTAILSRYAGELEQHGSKSLFTCRITDFSPELRHGRLALLQFDQAQIARYLRLSFKEDKIRIEGTSWPVKKLAGKLVGGQLSVDARNPFILSLLCRFFRVSARWPESRVTLFGSALQRTYEEKRKNEGRPDLPLFEEAVGAWSRFAWLLTESNRGTAIPRELLDVDGESNRSQTMIDAGLWCGVLGESVEPAQHLIRFEHHRYQEYLAARFIHETRQPVDWLRKLDAPRWQETMINLVLLGGAEDGVDALVSAIGTEVTAMCEAFARREAWEAEQEARKKEAAEKKEEGEGEEKKEGTEATVADAPGPPLPAYAAEALLADRVELAARLIPQGKKVSTAVEERLQPCLREAAGLLLERGEPLTQVKMMRACRDLEDPGLRAALGEMARSPVQWVRDQAVLLVADLPTEMGLDLARHSFLARLPVFFRGARDNGEAAPWLALLSATLLGLADAAVLLAGAVGLAALVLPGLRFAVSETQLATPGRFPLSRLLLLQAVITGPALVLALTRNAQRAWFWVLGSVALALPLSGAALGMWQKDWESCMLLYAIPVLLLLSPVVALASAVPHLLALAAYALLTRRLRRTSTFSTFVRTAWQDCGYARSVRQIRNVLVYGPLVLLFLGFAGLLFFLFTGLTEWLFQNAGRPYVEKQSETELVMLVVALVYLVFRSLHGPEGKRFPWLRPLRGFMQGLSHLAVAATFLVLIGGVGALLIGGLNAVFAGLEWAFERLSGEDFLPKAFVLAAAGWGLYVLVRELSWALRNLLLRFSHQPLPHAMTPEEWRARLAAARPREQQNLLLRTNHQTLKLDAQGFLDLLAEVKDAIKGEAAGTYWERRDRLEQTLLQERRG